MEEYLLVFNSSEKSFRPRKMSNEINHTNLHHITKSKSNYYKNANKNSPEGYEIESEENAVSSISKNMINDRRIVAVNLFRHIL